MWLIHRFAEEFEDHAILKGGLVLRLLDSPRLTNDIDFVLVPYSKKREIAPKVRAIIEELADADVDINLHSSMLRATIRIDGVGVQVECAVAPECPSIPMTTAAMAEVNGYPPKVIRVMDPAVALAHKLAAWNERRLIRDLYDAYFFVARVGVEPDLATLEDRLRSIRSRRPELKRTRTMTIAVFKDVLSQALTKLTDRDVDEELGGLLPAAARVGLSVQIRVALTGALQSLA
ncbi:MAG: nucleotidyl transferase AbiEii/AbiGii toxin family protein [Rhodothermia bacterium]